MWDISTLDIKIVAACLNYELSVCYKHVFVNIFLALLRNISTAAVDHRAEHHNQDQELAAKFSELPPQDILCQAGGRTGKCQKHKKGKV